jgi:hypothetical protein
LPGFNRLPAYIDKSSALTGAGLWINFMRLGRLSSQTIKIKTIIRTKGFYFFCPFLFFKAFIMLIINTILNNSFSK